MSKYIALVGDLSQGYEAVGPYDNIDEAAKEHDGPGVWLMSLTEPEKQPVEERALREIGKVLDYNMELSKQSMYALLVSIKDCVSQALRGEFEPIDKRGIP